MADGVAGVSPHGGVAAAGGGAAAAQAAAVRNGPQTGPQRAVKQAEIGRDMLLPIAEFTAVMRLSPPSSQNEHPRSHRCRGRAEERRAAAPQAPRRFAVVSRC